MAKTTFPAAWRLTPLETAYLARLRSGKILGAGDLIALHAGVPLKPAHARRNVGRVMAGLRRKLDPVNVEINTRWNEGWILDRAARSRLTALMGAK